MPVSWCQGCCDAIVPVIMMPRSGKSAVHWESRKGAEQVTQSVPYKYRHCVPVVAYN